jgi:hypothetical protein
VAFTPKRHGTAAFRPVPDGGTAWPAARLRPVSIEGVSAPRAHASSRQRPPSEREAST